MTHEQYLKQPRFGSLDGLRCLAVLAVIWHHTAVGVASVPATHRGFLGVDLFFVLSGFLIVTLLLREREASGRISLPRFYARRTLRIFPAYYAVLGLLAAAYAIFPDARTAPAFLGALPFYLTYTANWVIDEGSVMFLAWSLAAEEQFYLLWPPLEKWLRRREIWLALACALLWNQIVNFRLLGLGFDDRQLLHLEILQVTFTPILLGVALAHWLHSPAGYAIAVRLLGHRWSSTAAAIAVLAAANAPVAVVQGWPRLCTHLAMAALIGSCALRRDHWLGPVLDWRPIRRVGVVSYGMYLFHMLVKHAVVAAGLADFGPFPFAAT